MTTKKFTITAIIAFLAIISFFSINSYFADVHHLNTALEITGIVLTLVLGYILYKAKWN